eukprot:CAMPEP_0197287186 /NCGR_PEP_ID=MMETSP0890-20130614/3315_1 /TAXON_ID=44058 ORGANISM="Aureoumbra lagunensis, Strain CCMP1510" /NCGR_SAMPLE_ID=MMETSP0890 /ASSEMBLY_ACC=CAM_ASM_000533 /LENGTH=823 /DNA_ID=CAMNT_0042756553 /DNA_START=26 /DNA_END=2497 /DNA_ORIENTATION=+
MELKKEAGSEGMIEALIKIITEILQEFTIEMTEETEEMINYAAAVIQSDEVAAAVPILQEIEAPSDIGDRILKAMQKAGLSLSQETIDYAQRKQRVLKIADDEAIERNHNKKTSPKGREKKKKKNLANINKSSLKNPDDEEQEALDEIDDFASAWRECQKQGKAWGGRGFGGRGIARQYQTMSTASRDIVIDGVTLAFAGKELLKRTTLRLVNGRRYVLLGENGVGKTTLLRRMATHSLPGFPPHLRVGYLAQEVPVLNEDELQVSAMDALMRGACARRKQALEAERDEIEAQLSNEDIQEFQVLTSRLCQVDAELESLQEGSVQKKAQKALSALGFDKSMRQKKAIELSGGWQKRVELAAAVLEAPDVLLCDEPTNHLDLEGVIWLENYLQNTNCTQLIVSHDRAFVAAVATDIITFDDQQQLQYFAGDLHAFEKHQSEQAAAQQHRLDARIRQETAARDAAEKMKQKATAHRKKSKGTNDNALRAAKQRLAKIERIGLYREDGKRFKTHSLSEMSEKGMLLPEKVEPTRQKKQFAFTLPYPAPLSITSDYISLDGVDIGYSNSLLTNVVVNLAPGSRICCVGKNGCGKTTLLRTIAGLIPSRKGEIKYGHPNLRVAYVPQDHAEFLGLDVNTSISACAYLMNRFQISETLARAQLGKFGIAEIAKLQLNKCSGGQKARLALACATFHAPHVLLLDEPTNHLSHNALDALAAALNEYKNAAIIVISHNRAFLSACCNELWSLDSHNKLTVHRDADFSVLFAAYADRVLHSGTGGLSGTQTQISDKTRLDRIAGALDAVGASSHSKKGYKVKAGAAANRSALI